MDPQWVEGPRTHSNTLLCLNSGTQNLTLQCFFVLSGSSEDDLMQNQEVIYRICAIDVHVHNVSMSKMEYIEQKVMNVMNPSAGGYQLRDWSKATSTRLLAKEFDQNAIKSAEDPNNPNLPS